MKRMADSANATPAVPRKRRKKVFSRRLKLSVNGKAKSLYDFTAEYAEITYPHIGSQTYRVPPIYFNHQNVVTQNDSQPASDSAHSSKRTPQSLTVNPGKDNTVPNEGGHLPGKDSSLDELRTVSFNISSSSSPPISMANVTESNDVITNKEKVHIADHHLNINASDLQATTSNYDDNISVIDIGKVSDPDSGSDEEQTHTTSSDVRMVSEDTNSTSSSKSEQAQQPARPDNTPKAKLVQHKISLMIQPQDTLARRDKALSGCLDAFEFLGFELERLGERGLFIISGVTYENYLNRLPRKVMQNFEVPRPQDVATRGELDILILHNHAGILLVQVKSVGENLASWNASDAEAATAIKKVTLKAAGMTLRDEAVFKHVLQDLDPPPTFTKVVALPFVSRSEFEKAMAHKDELTATYRLFLTDIKILCKDEIEDTLIRCNTENIVKHIPAPCEPDTGFHKSGMYMWWHKIFQKNGTRLIMDHMKTIVGRVSGLLSSLHVQPDSKQRVEVRTYGQAVSETADRTAATVLTPTLYEMLGSPDPFVAVVGPPGAGKTMLLELKARRWLEEGRCVVVVNYGPDEAGLPNAHALLEKINSGLSDDGNPRALRLDLQLCNRVENLIENKINDFIQGQQGKGPEGQAGPNEGDASVVKPSGEGKWNKINFIVDDALLLKKMKYVLKFLRDHPATMSVWCSTSGFQTSNENDLPGYSIKGLPNVVRCPPTVQALLRKLEQRDDWKPAYATCSVDAGLPTKGPPLMFFHHQSHSAASKCLCLKRSNLQEGARAAETRPVASAVTEPSAERSTQPQSSTTNLLECRQCADEVAAFIVRLIKESEKPEYPSLFHPRKQEGLKSRCPGVLQFKDVVIVTPQPRQIKDGKIEMFFPEERKKAHWNYVSTSPFVTGLQEKGIPVKVVRSEGAKDIAIQSNEQAVILTDAFIVRSLERKVVIFVPHTEVKGTEDNHELIQTPVQQPACSPSFEDQKDNVRSQKTVVDHPGERTLSAADLTIDGESATESSDKPKPDQTLDAEVQDLHPSSAAGVPGSSAHPSTSKMVAQPAKEGVRPVFPEVQHSSRGNAGQRQGCFDALSIDQIVGRLSLLNRETLYRAAACCISQFVLIVP